LHAAEAQEILALGHRGRLLRKAPLWRLAPTSQHPAAGSVEAVIREHLPSAAFVGVLLGPPRANAKPVLQVFDAAGATVAFGKVGHNELTQQLVRAEAATLATLHGTPFRHVRVPAVLHAGSWRGGELLLMSTMASSQSRMSSWTPPLDAMAEIAEHGGVSHHDVEQSPYLLDLRERVRALPTSDASLSSLVEQVAERHAGTVLGFGRWHGDWAPWNMGLQSDHAEVWDWERSRAGVPLGFDLVHFLVQREFHQGADADQLERSLNAQVPAALARWYDTDEQVNATIALYVLEILERYAADSGDSPTARLKNRMATLMAIVSRAAADRSRRPRAGA